MKMILTLGFFEGMEMVDDSIIDRTKDNSGSQFTLVV